MFSKQKKTIGLKKTQFVALQSLPYYDEIVVKMKAGVPCSQIASWIQVIKKDHTDKKRQAIQKQLERMRKNIAPKDILDKRLLEAKEKELDEMVSIVKESHYLLKLAKKRVQRNEANEKKFPVTMPQQDAAIRLMMDTLTIHKEYLQDIGMLSKDKDEERSTININGDVNLNMTEDELKAREEEVVGRIKSRLKRIDALRSGRKGGKDVKGKEVPTPESTLSDDASNNA